MLDWTTSFLSDETIIKPRSGFCQIVSCRLLAVVVSEPEAAKSERDEKGPASRSGASDENQPEEATPQNLEINP
jgi:hypothetical protein